MPHLYCFVLLTAGLYTVYTYPFIGPEYFPQEEFPEAIDLQEQFYGQGTKTGDIFVCVIFFYFVSRSFIYHGYFRADCCSDTLNSFLAIVFIMYIRCFWTVGKMLLHSADRSKDMLTVDV